MKNLFEDDVMESRKLRLHIKSFRAIKDADIQLSGITVVTGENGSGKSTISRLLYHVLNCSIHFDTYAVQDIGNWVSTCVLKLRDFLFDLDPQQSLSAKDEGFKVQTLAGRHSDTRELGLAFLRVLDEGIVNEEKSPPQESLDRVSYILSD
ncbi:MAG: AAA family ATPase, partial [Planctomycetia bacterium]|nr:AAA family ATPase [Planctomycetia bacterium]